MSAKRQRFGEGVEVDGAGIPLKLEISEDSPGEWDISFVLGAAKGEWKTDLDARYYAVECLKALIEKVLPSPEEVGARTPMSILFDEAVRIGLLQYTQSVQLGLVSVGWLRRKSDGWELTALGEAILARVSEKGV